MTDLPEFSEPTYDEDEGAAHAPVGDDWLAPLPTVDDRLTHIEAQNEKIIDGLNTVGAMLNSIVEGVEGAMNMLNSGGAGGILGKLMGGK